MILFAILMTDVQKQFQQLQSSTSEADMQTRRTIDELSKEKENLLELVMSRDRIIQVSY